jgi:hypothetical protein
MRKRDSQVYDLGAAARNVVDTEMFAAEKEYTCKTDLAVG